MTLNGYTIPSPITPVDKKTIVLEIRDRVSSGKAVNRYKSRKDTAHYQISGTDRREFHDIQHPVPVKGGGGLCRRRGRYIYSTGGFLELFYAQAKHSIKAECDCRTGGSVNGI